MTGIVINLFWSHCSLHIERSKQKWKYPVYTDLKANIRWFYRWQSFAILGKCHCKIITSSAYSVMANTLNWFMICWVSRSVHKCPSLCRLSIENCRKEDIRFENCRKEGIRFDSKGSSCSFYSLQMNSFQSSYNYRCMV